jgi:hypothetical protein
MFFPFLVFKLTIAARFSGLLVENIVSILPRQVGGEKSPFSPPKSQLFARGLQSVRIPRRNSLRLRWCRRGDSTDAAPACQGGEQLSVSRIYSAICELKGRSSLLSDLYFSIAGAMCYSWGNVQA